MKVEAARILGVARFAKTGVSLQDKLIPADEDEAYGVQTALHEWQQEQGQGRIVGYKIGCTTPTMQRIVGVPNPTFGGILDVNVSHDYGTYAFKNFQKVGIECEIAVRLSSDLPASGAPYDRPAIEAAVGSCMAAIEVVDNRYGDYLSIQAPVLIADDFFQAACVLGAEINDWRNIDLSQIEGRTYIDGRFVGCGPGSDILGHPLEAVVWIVNRMAALGRGLKAGEFILTGSLVAVQWLDHAPVEAVISIDGLGDVQASFV
ncbi:MAG: fumarylacetoacetate hydrolase family protein [Rhodospirillales bacterium]|nr:fumarylacetoacetate hydrolase family protein [Rhodospirillales bacterium]